MNTVGGMEQTARALTYYTRLQDVTANNLANMTTTGFKLDRLTAAQAADGTYPVAVPALDLSQGRTQPTGRDLDVSLEGPAFLVVSTANGEQLSRGGSLRLDSEGQLTTADGSAVLGDKGPIVLPPGKLEIATDGTVTVDGERIDQLRVVTANEPVTLLKEGNSRFVSASGTTPTTTGTKIVQGSLEEPNGDTLHGMIDLITIQRAYSANVDALKAMDHVLDTVAGDVGRVPA
jgi:flagellar basal body rod protein FlgG